MYNIYLDQDIIRCSMPLREALYSSDETELI